VDIECAKCDDENGYLKIIDGLEKWVRCECLERKRIKRIIKSSEITDEFLKKTFLNFDLTNKNQLVKKSYATAISYDSQFELIRKTRENSISIFGNVGSGKTHLLCAVANNLMSRGIELLYFPFVEGFNNLKSNMDSVEEKIERIKKVQVLFIDDLFKGRTQPTPFEVSQVYAIINYRYLNMLPILVTSEKNINQLREIDEAIASRIYEMSSNHTVVIKGENTNHRMRNYSE
jgi:DNA replication protein DnaC